ncbi:MAG: hypothetical protein Q8O89_05605 [Nanoarchaeota archaeon]|nr:hypothetical protein [Nanoarchaeota archaeon]
MINIEDQEQLLKLISRRIKKNISCYAFGGTAMMFYGYKNSTKDIDLVFGNEDDLSVFCEAIQELGYKKKSLLGIYKKEKIDDKNAPLMFTRGEERFDLFLKKIFRTELSEKMKERLFGRHEFIEKDNSLIINILSKEDIILLKSITERENDYNDVLTICEKDEISWDIIVDEAIRQSKNGDEWILIDLEETMNKLKEKFFIKEKYFKKIYDAQSARKK